MATTRKRVRTSPVVHNRRKTDAALESAEQFRLAQVTLGIVTWVWNPGTERTQWYGDASRLLGLAPGSFSGRFQDYLKHVHPEDAAKAKQTFIDCLQGRVAEYRAVERVTWPDGSEH